MSNPGIVAEVTTLLRIKVTVYWGRSSRHWIARRIHAAAI
jgi:hypothetical protein